MDVETWACKRNCSIYRITCYSLWTLLASFPLSLQLYLILCLSIRRTLWNVFWKGFGQVSNWFCVLYLIRFVVSFCILVTQTLFVKLNPQLNLQPFSVFLEVLRRIDNKHGTSAGHLPSNWLSYNDYNKMSRTHIHRICNDYLSLLTSIPTVFFAKR